VPYIPREHRGIVIDGYALILFQDEIVLGTDAKRDVDVPIRGAFLRSIHCKIIWSILSGYVIERHDLKAEVKVNGTPIERAGLGDGDIITLGKAFSPQATLRFRLPANCGNSAVLEFPVSGAALDLFHIPSLSSTRTRHVLLLRDFGTIGHDPEAHIYVPDFPCCNIMLWWIENRLMAEAARGVFQSNELDCDKVALSSPSSLHLTGLPCIHQLRSLLSRFRPTCDLHILDSYHVCSRRQ
jgi:hypothetical protein